MQESKNDTPGGPNMEPRVPHSSTPRNRSLEVCKTFHIRCNTNPGNARHRRKETTGVDGSFLVFDKHGCVVLRNEVIFPEDLFAGDFSTTESISLGECPSTAIWGPLGIAQTRCHGSRCEFSSCRLLSQSVGRYPQPSAAAGPCSVVPGFFTVQLKSEL